MNAQLFYLPVCGSTNDYILEYASPNHITGLHTGHQTAGRGQYGCTWQTPPNTNVTLSLALPVENIPLSATIFNFYTACQIRNFIAKMTQKEVFIKWPNDLILANKKIAGILLEQKKINSVQYYIIGIGINVLQENFPNLPHAGSLRTQCGIEYDPRVVAEELFHHLHSSLDAAPDADTIVNNYNANLYLRGKVACFEIAKMRQNGIIQQADSDGFLWVELERDDLQRFYHKEITLLY